MADSIPSYYFRQTNDSIHSISFQSCGHYIHLECYEKIMN